MVKNQDFTIAFRKLERGLVPIPPDAYDRIFQCFLLNLNLIFIHSPTSH